MAKFEAERHTLDGRPIKLKLKALGSREIYLAVLNGTEKPDLISPAGSLQISILQDQSTGKFGQSIVNQQEDVLNAIRTVAAVAKPARSEWPA